MKISATNRCPKKCIFVGEATGISVPNGGESYSPSSLISRDFKGREAKESNPICKQITSTLTGDTSAGERGSLPTPEQYNYISRGHRGTDGQVGPKGERKQMKMKISATNGCPKKCIFVGEATGISVPNGGEGWKDLIDFSFAWDKQNHKSCAAEKLRKRGPKNYNLWCALLITKKKKECQPREIRSSTGAKSSKGVDQRCK
ncbi:hypothetical protein AAC387_Pa02g2516 [Persea americana]